MSSVAEERASMLAEAQDLAQKANIQFASTLLRGDHTITVASVDGSPIFITGKTWRLVISYNPDHWLRGMWSADVFIPIGGKSKPDILLAFAQGQYGDDTLAYDEFLESIGEEEDSETSRERYADYLTYLRRFAAIIDRAEEETHVALSEWLSDTTHLEHA